MEKKKINIIYDASVLAFNFQKNSARSGIFFTALNILNELLDRPDVNVYLYMSPQNYAEELYFYRNHFPKAIYLHDFSSYAKAGVAKICSLLWKIHETYEIGSIKRKFTYVFILICRCFFYLTVKIKKRSHILKDTDFYFSPIYRIPKFIHKYSNIKPIIFLHDAIPLLPVYGDSISKANLRSHQKLVKSFTNNYLFFSNSLQTKKDFEKIVSAVNDFTTTVIPLAASELFVPQNDTNKVSHIKRKYKIPEEKKYVFSLCSLEPRKNLIRAIKAFFAFVKKNDIRDIIWVMGGSAWESFSPLLQKELSDDFEAFIIQTGYIDDEDLPVLYSNAEWFVYTSQYEGFGLPLLEAMQCGCPVISGNASSLPEVIGDAGIMIEWDSEEQHIDAYEKYYFNEKLRNANRHKGIERAKLFSWQTSVGKMASVMAANLQKNSEKLNIIYRMCDKINASSLNTRCFNVSKNNLIKKCLLNLKKNVDNYKGNYNLYCIADNCSEDIVSFVKELFPDIHLTECQIGNAKSFCKCIKLASELPNGEQVYFLEDDYLLLNDNVLNLLNHNLSQISKEISEKIAIMPDDYPDRYVENAVETECRITDTGHFLRIDKTTCTFATYTDVIKKYKKLFLKFINWPRMTERASVNKVWKHVPLYQPIPAWTLHSQTKSVIPAYLDFEKLKNFFED